jgi:vacuolar protein sorting-associated protein 54
MDLSDILASACELANARAAKILGVRADQHAALSITEFVEIFKENWEFVVATETLAKRMIVSLRGVTASQVGIACGGRGLY